MNIKGKKSYGSKMGAAVVLNEGQGKESVTYLTELTVRLNLFRVQTLSILRLKTL